ncbi:hypothetical protein BACERE00191_01964 [Bacillus pacificus]|uniref:Lipoprotein n=1 Tax=Bacillus pacificus TaxID=2026187 RepID=A0A1Y5ZG89_9BACI|nr:hypothetical protein [Bacillus pacificus]SMD93946.1 hypothetical protein BACERE00191_01964 [Bacillus pacificus]
MEVIKIKLVRYLILLCISATTLFLLTACQKEIKEPIIIIDDATSQKENLRRIELKNKNNNAIFNQVFFESKDGKTFYDKQIDVNDIRIKQNISNKKIQPGVLPEQNYIFLSGFSNKNKPNYLLGRIEQEDGKVIQWKQEIKYMKKNGTKDVYQYEIQMPKFEGKQAYISFRYIWLNTNNKCYGVADQLFTLQKIKSGNILEDVQQ